MLPVPHKFNNIFLALFRNKLLALIFENIFSLYRLAQEENTLKTYACDKNSTFVIERPSLLFFLHFPAVDAVINKKAKRFLRGNSIGYALYKKHFSWQLYPPSK